MTALPTLVVLLLSAGSEVALRPFTGPVRQMPPRVPIVVSHAGKTFTVTNAGARWEVTAAQSKPFAKATADERAVGAAILKGNLVLAVHGPDQTQGTLGERVRAMDHLAKGDGKPAAQLAGPAHGALITLDATGTVVRREPVDAQRPAGLAVTADGWLVLLTQGTLAKGLRDAQLLGRAPGAKGGWQVLASDLEMPGQVTARGAWVCVSEMPGPEDRVAHCVDPGRALWVKSPRLKGNLFLLDVAVLHHQEYVNHAPVDRYWTMPLP